MRSIFRLSRNKVLQAMRISIVVVIMSLTIGCSGYEYEPGKYIPEDGEWSVGYKPAVNTEYMKESGAKRYDLARRIEAIVEEVKLDVGVDGYQKIKDANYELTKYDKGEHLQGLIKDLEKFQYTRRLNFYSDLLGDVAAAQRLVAVNPAPGMYFAIVSPYERRISKICSIDIPWVADDVMVIKVPVLFADTSLDSQERPHNKMVYNYCMQLVYRFFDGELTKEQIDRAAHEAIEKGKLDRRWYDLLSQQAPSLTDFQNHAISILSQIAISDPKTKIVLRANGKQYTFEYSSYGQLNIKFRWY